MTTSAPPARAASSGLDIAWMTAGTAAIGASGFVFLAVVGDGRLDPAAAAALASVYLLSNILGPGVFVAVEQETSRRVGAAAGLDAAAGPTAGGAPRDGRSAWVAAGLAAVTLVALLAAAVPLTRTAFHGDAALVGALAVGVVGSAAVFRVRGLLGGQRRFRRYGYGLLVDAVVRIAGVLALAVGGVTTAWAYAVAWCVAPAAAALATRVRSPEAAGAGRGMPRAVAALLVGSLLAMTVANLSPVLVNAALPAEPTRAFAFACALVLTRAPLLLTGPVQALMLPSLSAAAARGETADVHRRLRRGLIVVGVIGLIAVPGAAVLGRPVIALVFGRDADLLPAGTVAALAGSAMLLMAVALVQPVLIAVSAHRAVVLGWVGGVLSFGVAFGALVAVDPITAAVAAGLAAPVVTLAIQLCAVRRGASRITAPRS